MTIKASIRRAFRADTTPSREPVHFHRGNDGQAYVCDFDRCESQPLTLREVDPGRRR